MEEMRELALYLEKSNQVARNQDWQALTRQSLDLLQEICQAEATLLYLPGCEAVWSGCPYGISEETWAAARTALLQPAMFQGADAQLLIKGSEALSALCLPEYLQNLLILPQPDSGTTHCGFLVVNARQPRSALAMLIASRMATELEKAAQVAASSQREVRLRELNDILGQLGASLDPDQVLRMFIQQAQQFLQVEAVSLFMLDENSGESVLQIASQEGEQIQIEQLRVPAGQGIIGLVIQSGKTELVQNVHSDQRHYEQADQASGFTTRSILAVPLRTRSIDLGQERGVSSERIIGGLEAINKISGPFQEEDKELLQILAKGAATILVEAQLYKDANKLFLDVTQAIVAAIDAKDPYTKGHSQRVSDYSVEIAHELHLSGEEVYQVRLGSLVHDVGKIGIPDRILRKKSPLKPFEIKRMRLHTTIGQSILSKVQLMHDEIPAMVGHHERLDGSGYPSGLHGEEISPISRIVAVADVFDAMTSNRPYRAGLPVDEVFAYLRKNSGTHFDSACVEALVSAYYRGGIRTQSERY
jgi:putative methionine-R-sulfoxide reductase with GAF domain